VRGENGSRSGSVQGRRSGEIIEEEDEEDLEVEEVEEFSPVKFGDEEVLVEEDDVGLRGLSPDPRTSKDSMP
jgi:hypothetical protein